MKNLFKSKIFGIILITVSSFCSFQYCSPLNTNNLSNDNEFIFKISYIHELIIKKGYNCTDIIDYFLERAYTYNPKINAIISFNPNAKAEALKQDIYYRENQKPIGKLHCIPTLVKDNIGSTIFFEFTVYNLIYGK